MKAARAGLILQEPFFSRKAADRLAGQTGAKVVVTANSVGGEEAASDYLALFDLIVKRLHP
jgi:ABC-type Zn uptake system ZnuABC Zn-binding protein ZnuA